MSSTQNFRLDNDQLPSIFSQLAVALGVKVTTDCRRSHLDLSEAGEVILYQDNTGIDSLFIHLEGKVEWNFRFTGASPATISFLTSAAGEIRLSSHGERFAVSPLQSVIHGGFSHHTSEMALKSDNNLMIALLALDKPVFFSDMNCSELDIPEKLLRVVEALEEVGPGFLYRDIYHLPIINALQDVVKQENKGLINSTFAAAKTHEMLFLALNEYKKSANQPYRRLVRQQERIKLIKNAKEILVSRLQEPPTIPELARMVGLNQQTLKQGFRQLFGNSIKQYLTDKRLEQAGILIKAGELTLREVATEVGYNNPGYFSRRFREKYGVSPRYFNQSKQ